MKNRNFFPKEYFLNTRKLPIISEKILSGKSPLPFSLSLTSKKIEPPLRLSLFLTSDEVALLRKAIKPLGYTSKAATGLQLKIANAILDATQ